MTEYLVSGNLASCYGCTACEQKCPTKAIKMERNFEGFLYPIIDEEKCVKCGLCRAVCPKMIEQAQEEPQKVYAFEYKNDKTKESSSGGAFMAFADAVLARDGIVVGCVFDENYNVIHTLANNLEDVQKMQGSKYVQSDLRDVYAQIKTQLNCDKLVLFSGTPCQVAGLKAFLGKQYEKLITVDLICHGTPSPGLFEKYLQVQEKKYGAIEEFSFRKKAKYGWQSCGYIKTKKKKITISPFEDSFYNLFYIQNCILRKSCYSCKYACPTREGDITIGDYWGVKEVLPAVNCDNGVSVVLVNTKKGSEWFDVIKGHAEIQETEYVAARKGNGNLERSTKEPASRADIFTRVNEEGYEAVARKQCKLSKFIPKLKRKFPKKLKKLLKKIIRRGGNA